MSDPAPPPPLSDAEARDFRELGLTPGCWAALAPVPLLRFPAMPVPAPDFQPFREVAGLFPGGAGEPEAFWGRWEHATPPAFAVSLLGWYLAHRISPADREAYLAKLREVAAGLLPELLKDAGGGVVAGVTAAIAAAIGRREYSRELIALPAPAADPAPASAEPSTVLIPPPRPLCEVTTASDFKPLTFAESLARARKVTVAAVRDWLADPANAGRLLFDNFRTDCPEVAIVPDPDAVPRSLWVVGDVHADVLALANLIEFARREGEKEGEPPAFVFLGDFVDRGRHDHETLLLVFDLVTRDPGRVCVVPGNHDVDLRWGEKSQKFGVTITPAEYCDHLNGLVGGGAAADRERVELARLAIEFWRGRPRAVFLPDGTLLSHGGFPHTDTHDSLKTRADLGSRRCLDDFLWARLSESPRKRPNRGNRGHEFGSNDFSQFCRVMTGQLGVPVRRFVRGHDHVLRRWQLPHEYLDHPVLTINAMGWRMDGEGEPSDGPHPLPVVARHVPGELPRVVRVPLDPVEVDRGLGRVPPEPEPEPWDEFPSAPYVGDQQATPPPSEPGGGA